MRVGEWGKVCVRERERVGCAREIGGEESGCVQVGVGEWGRVRVCVCV